MAMMRRNGLIATFAFGCTLPFASQAFGQTIRNSFPQNRIENIQTVTVTVQAAPRQHVGNGPIDMSNLSPEILNCEVCRQRLGLPPLNSRLNAASNSSTSSVKPTIRPAESIPGNTIAPTASSLSQLQLNQLSGGRMLGSPGMITSATAEQMAMNGMVVEEFKPPQPEPNAIQLGALPPEVRQEFIRGLGLPAGARIMSAEIKGQAAGLGIKAETIDASATAVNPKTASSESPKGVDFGGKGIVSTADADAESIVAVNQKPSTSIGKIPDQSIPLTPAPQMKPMVDFSIERDELKQTVEKLRKQLEEQEFAFAAKKSQIEAELSTKKQAIWEMQQQLEQKAIKLDSQMELIQSESKKRLEQSEAANNEVLAMLEKRTAEVTELQLQLAAQKDAGEKVEKELVQVKEELTKAVTATVSRSTSDKPGNKKKQQSKGKKTNPNL
jgi:hypothetical protein